MDIPGPVVDKLSKISEENKIHLVTGIIERDQGTLFCSVIFFDDTGKHLVQGNLHHVTFIKIDLF